MGKLNYLKNSRIDREIELFCRSAQEVLTKIYNKPSQKNIKANKHKKEEFIACTQ